MTWEILPAREFPRYREAWNQLNAANGGSQLLDFDFVNIARDCFSSEKDVLGVFTENDAVEAMGIFSPGRRLAWHTFQPANAPLGAWLSRPGQSPEKYMASLFRRLPGLALLLAISQQDPDIVPPPPASATIGLLDYIVTSRITIETTFDDYWQSRGKNLRHNIKRQSNRLERESLPGRLEIVIAAGAMAAAVASYADLESRGWKGQENSAVERGDTQSRFYAQILAHYAERGQASVWRYFIGDKLAASDICIERDGVLIVLKTAYDEDFKGYSPAQLMNYEAFRSVFADGKTKRIEFYGPVKDWHTKWTDETRTMYHINFYRWPWLRTLLPGHGKS